MVEAALSSMNPPPWKYTTSGSLAGGVAEEWSSRWRGRNIRTQVLFDWLMGTSLVKTGVGRLGSQVAGLSGNLVKRVIVPSGMDARLRNL